ncbi:MAG: hypothetical protein JWQ59_2400, partial [Cryobacterium sp.]|nr:hypothetical protein [Cryobacterium sp.]
PARQDSPLWPDYRPPHCERYGFLAQTGGSVGGSGGKRGGGTLARGGFSGSGTFAGGGFSGRGTVTGGRWSGGGRVTCAMAPRMSGYRSSAMWVWPV